LVVVAVITRSSHPSRIRYVPPPVVPVVGDHKADSDEETDDDEDDDDDIDESADEPVRIIHVIIIIST